MKRVVITGATSFIGISLMKKLLALDINILAIIRPGTNRRNFLPTDSRIIYVESELSELQKISPKKKYDAFFHIGWSSDFEKPRTNIIGQLQNVMYAENAVRLASKIGCKTFLAIGSQAECGIVNGCITASTPDNPRTAYAIAKVITYSKCLSLCELYKMKFCWPRLLSAYGPYDRKHTLIMTCLQAGMEKKEVELTSGEQIWDYIYVDDVAECLFAICKNGKHGKRYPIGSGIGRSLKSYIIDVARITKNRNIMTGVGKRAYSKDQVMNLVADISELTFDTGWVPQIDFEDGIKRTLRAMKYDLI